MAEPKNIFKEPRGSAEPRLKNTAIDYHYLFAKTITLLQPSLLQVTSYKLQVCFNVIHFQGLVKASFKSSAYTGYKATDDGSKSDEWKFLDGSTTFSNCKNWDCDTGAGCLLG